MSSKTKIVRAYVYDFECVRVCFARSRLLLQKLFLFDFYFPYIRVLYFAWISIKIENIKYAQ